MIAGTEALPLLLYQVETGGMPSWKIVTVNAVQVARDTTAGTTGWKMVVRIPVGKIGLYLSQRMRDLNCEYCCNCIERISHRILLLFFYRCIFVLFNYIMHLLINSKVDSYTH